MFSDCRVISVLVVVTLGCCEVPRWQQQIPYNDIAHLFHAMYREMYIPFNAPNRTAGDIIMHKMQTCKEGVKELYHLTDVTPEQEFHKKYLQPVRFMIVRGRRQWNMISYRDEELVQKYGWSEAEITMFRDLYRDILDMVNEMEQFCSVRHIDLSDL